METITPTSLEPTNTPSLPMSSAIKPTTPESHSALDMTSTSSPLATETCSDFLPRSKSSPASEPGENGEDDENGESDENGEDDEEVNPDVDVTFRWLWADIKTGNIADNGYPLEACDIAWVQEYAQFLMAVPAGCERRPKELVDCVYLWISVEERWSQNVEHRALPQELRVDGLAYWFKAHRMKMAKPPAEVTLPGIRDQFWAWLGRCAPNWMERDNKGRLLPSGPFTDGDFGSLVCPGTSGVVLLLVTLHWWCDRGGPNDKSGFWFEAARCIHSLLSGLLISPFPDGSESPSTSPSPTLTPTPGRRSQRISAASTLSKQSRTTSHSNAGNSRSKKRR
ncbi:SERTA domain-containing protein 3 [Paramarasmius palmivorus]|uniref:SERTA domain-containing protein 3 n=1 Tax=Paramarasmius palmivorus TaxID=297713 RepID=A0AAW0ATD8_9AGAR